MARWDHSALEPAHGHNADTIAFRQRNNHLRHCGVHRALGLQLPSAGRLDWVAFEGTCHSRVIYTSNLHPNVEKLRHPACMKRQATIHK